MSPLALPSEPNPTAVLSSPAGQMFLDRARAVAPGYSVTRESAPVITEICRRLDGVPLALELAAAHARLLDPTTLLQRLDQAVAAGRSRELPPRQRTMQATLDWSHALLTRDEQVLLRRLSVFAGGFTLPVAEAVLERVSGDDLDVFAALAGLVDQSLVVTGDADGRYRLLEPIRQYAAARLADADETTMLAAAHAERIADLGAEALGGLRGRDQRRWLDRLDREHGNLRAALAWWIEPVRDTVRPPSSSPTPGSTGLCEGTQAKAWSRWIGSWPAIRADSPTSIEPPRWSRWPDCATPPATWPGRARPAPTPWRAPGRAPAASCSARLCCWPPPAPPSRVT